MTAPDSAPALDRPHNIHNPMDIFRFIVDYKRTHDGNSPTLREIMAACQISSSSVAKWHLKQLERRGLIQLSGIRKSSRSLIVVGGQWTYAPKE